MKKKIIIRSVESKPPTHDQFENYLQEAARIMADYYLDKNTKIAVKTGDSDYMLIDNSTGEELPLREHG